MTIMREADMEFSRSFTRITINGRTYGSVDEMPPDDRRTYDEMMAKLRTDTNKNGIPDFLEGGDRSDPIVQATHEIEVQGPIKSRVIENGFDDPSRTLRYSNPTRDPFRQSGITVHFTWGTLLTMALGAAVLTAIVVAIWR